MSLRSLRQGPAQFEPATGWPAFAATVAALLVFVVALLTAQGGVALAARAQSALLGGRQPPSSAATTVLFLLGLQLTIVALTLLLAGRGAPGRWRSLGLAPPPQAGAAVYGEAIAGGIALALIYNAAAFGLGFTDLVTDLQPFVALLRSPWWWMAVVVVAIGAPLAEELLFRGFLLPALSRTRIGFPGAALVTTLAWTGMHAGYTPAGLVEVFLMGLYFSWLLWRTGSLRVPLVCHAAFNSAVLAGLLVWMQL